MKALRVLPLKFLHQLVISQGMWFSFFPGVCMQEELLFRGRGENLNCNYFICCWWWRRRGNMLLIMYDRCLPRRERGLQLFYYSEAVLRPSSSSRFPPAVSTNFGGCGDRWYAKGHCFLTAGASEEEEEEEKRKMSSGPSGRFLRLRRDGWLAM